MKTLSQFFALSALVSSIVGCASVSVNKVDRTTGQLVVGAAEGMRFYLPRPYISVFEPFIVSSEVYLARGEMSPDSNYVLLTEVPAGLRLLVNDKLAAGTQSMDSLRIDASQVRVDGARRVGPQSASAADSPASAASAAAASAPASSASGAAGNSVGGQAKSGVLNYKAVNDNNAFAVTPQPRYFNILWLPDFDEQYVVTAKAGLGNAGVLVGFGQGWSLQSLEATVDNSSIAKPLLDFYSGTLGALQKLATAKIEAPLAALTGKPQGAPAADARTFSGGTPVTLKVTKVRIVAPGVYPLLKPGEMQGLALSAEEGKRILVPRPPLTNVAFNTYDVVVIEAAKTSGDSALRIQQYVDSTASPPAGAVGGGGATSSGSQFTAAQKALNIELSKPANSTKTKDYYIGVITQESGVVKVTLTKSANGTVGTLAALPDEATLKAQVVTILKANSVEVDAGGIFVKP